MKKLVLMALFASALMAECKLVYVSGAHCPACKTQNKILKDKSLTSYMKDNNISMTKYVYEYDKVPEQYNRSVVPYTFVVSNDKIVAEGRGVMSARAIHEALAQTLDKSTKQ